MVTRTVKIKNKLGLHARPSARVVQTTTKFRSEISLEKDGVKVNAKSILGVMMLAAGMGSMILITVDGEDEEEALKVVGELLEATFD